MKQSSPIVTNSQMKECDWIRHRLPIFTPFCISTNGPTKVPSPIVHPYRLTGCTTVTFSPNVTSTIPACRISGFATKVLLDGLNGWVRASMDTTRYPTDGPSELGSALCGLLLATSFTEAGSFPDQERRIGGQKILANRVPLQLVLNPAATISPHLLLKLGLVHELGNGFREFSFVVRFNIDGSVSRRKARFFQIESDDRLCSRHIFHDLDPRGHVVQRAGRIGVHANICSRKVGLQIFVGDEARKFNATVKLQISSQITQTL